MDKVISRDEFLEQAGALLRIRQVIEKAIEDKWTTTETMDVIKREMSLFNAEFDLLEKKAHDAIVRSALGVDMSAVIPADTYLKTLFLAVCVRPGRS